RDIRVDPENRLDEGLSRRTVGDALEEGHRVAVVPAQLGELEALAVPLGCRRHLQREGRSRHEALGGVVGVELELEGALESMRLQQPPDAQLGGAGTLGPAHAASVSTTSTRT